MRRLRYDLATSGVMVSWCWHVEPNPAGTGHHVHYWARGDYIPQALLSTKADGVGMGEVATVQQWTAPDLVAAGYGLKMAGVGYGLKGTQQEAQFGCYVRCNGGRLVHTSKGWWQDEHRRSVSYLSGMAAWDRVSRPSDRGNWKLLHDGDPILRGVQELAGRRETPMRVSVALQALTAAVNELPPSGGFDRNGVPLVADGHPPSLSTEVDDPSEPVTAGGGAYKRDQHEFRDPIRHPPQQALQNGGHQPFKRCSP